MISLFRKYSHIIPFIIGAWILVMFGSLHFGWLDCFYWSAEHSAFEGKGVDFFAVPKSFLNLMHGISAFDTWSSVSYGPYATWYLAHPAFSVFVASWFSFFDPWTGYWLFDIFSIGVLLYAARTIAKNTTDIFHKRLTYFFLICSFTTYSMIYVGNMQAPMVLSVALVLSALFHLAFSAQADKKNANNLLMAGLLISFFSKPIVLLMLPVLLINRLTRKTTFIAIVIYALVSLIFIFNTTLNPEFIGFDKIMGVLLNPDFAKEHLNIFKNNFKLNEYMKDNSIHWINLIAQSDHYLNHIEIFSMSAFINTLVGKDLPATVYKIPLLLSLLFSFGMLLLKDEKERLKYSFLVVCSIVFTFYLSYNTVWEYQYTATLPIIAFVPILIRVNPTWGMELKWVLFAGLFLCIPTFYVFFRSAELSFFLLNVIRFDRVVPDLIIFTVLSYLIIKRIILAVRTL